MFLKALNRRQPTIPPSLPRGTLLQRLLSGVCGMGRESDLLVGERTDVVPAVPAVEVAVRRKEAFGCHPLVEAVGRTARVPEQEH